MIYGTFCFKRCNIWRIFGLRSYDMSQNPVNLNYYDTDNQKRTGLAVWTGYVKLN
jgi:hypothetical protein